MNSFQSSLPWSERLDIVAEAAPLAPELSMEVSTTSCFFYAIKLLIIYILCNSVILIIVVLFNH